MAQCQTLGVWYANFHGLPLRIALWNFWKLCFSYMPSKFPKSILMQLGQQSHISGFKLKWKCTFLVAKLDPCSSDHLILKPLNQLHSLQLLFLAPVQALEDQTFSSIQCIMHSNYQEDRTCWQLKWRLNTPGHVSLITIHWYLQARHWKNYCQQSY